MKFLFVFIAYPDIRHNSNLYTELVSEIVRIGHEARVICPTFDSKTREKLEGGVKVLRVASGRIFNTSIIEKGINTVLLNRRYANAWRKFWYGWQMDWIVISTPPITLAPFVERVKNEKKASVYLILRDIFPQNAKDLGIIRSEMVFKYFGAKERRLYDISDIIGCMSPANIAFIEKQYPLLLKNKNVTFLPNWIKPSSKQKCLSSGATFRERFGLEEKFVALFGGNFGKPQKMEFIIELAEMVKTLKDVVFCLVGEGTEKKRIASLAELRRLDNLLIFDRLPREEYMSLVHEADIGLVNLSDKFTIPNIPSRTLAYWNSSLPVLAATDRHTDLNDQLLKKYDAGLWAETGNLDAYYSQFMKLYRNPDLRKRLGENGRKAVETEFCVQTVARKFLKQIAGEKES